MKFVAKLIRSIAAGGALLGILAGVPALLWVAAEQFLPSRLPSWAEVGSRLVAADDGSILLGVLVIAAFLAWLPLAGSIVAELVGVVSHRAPRRIDLPGFRLGGAIASGLVTALMGISSAPAVAAAPAPLATVSDIHHGHDGFRSVRAEPPADRDGPVHRVASRDTLWGIAEAVLGDPLRWREIYDLNIGRPQPDGGALRDPSDLVVGWELILPRDAHDAVRVAPGDTLSELAATHLGGTDQVDELFAANAGRRQPDGARLSDPDRLRPGWLLALPQRQPGDVADPARRPDPTAVPTPSPQPLPPGPTSAEPSATPAPTPPAPRSSSPPPPSTPATSSPSSNATPRPPEETASDLTPTIVVVTTTSAIVLAGITAALHLRRSRQLRFRPARRRIAVPTDADGRVEWEAARSTTITTTLLDAALRSLTMTSWDDADVPVLRTVELDGDHARLGLARPATAPPPFEAERAADSDDDVWILDGSASPASLPDGVEGQCAPFPVLVSVATDGDRTLLLNLEACPVLRVSGDPDAGCDLLRHIVATLATARWAEDVEVLVAGLGEDPVAINPERLTAVPDLDAALDELDRRSDRVADALANHDILSITAARLSGVAADSWLPVVLVAATRPTAAQADRLSALAASGSAVAVAVVVMDDRSYGVELNIDEDGYIDLAEAGDAPWRVERLSVDIGARLASLLGTTDQPAPPVQPADSPEQWAAGMAEDGGLEIGDGATKSTPGPPPASGAAPDPAALRRLAIVDHQDSGLDADLAAWRSADRPRTPQITILGEPAVRAPGPLPKARMSWFVEVLVYLSLNPAGVTLEKALTDLWPDGQQVSPATVRHAFYGARRWAGRGRDGNNDTAFVSDLQNDTVYRIRGHLLDWDLFRRLRKRGSARAAAGHPGAVEDYEAALGLVQGPVLSPLRIGGYAWLNNHDQRHDLQIPGFIVDTAHELVDITLASGDLARARRAAECARIADVDVAFDQPLTDLMRIAHAEDNQAELELCAAVLLDARGFEVPEELAPESFAVINLLMPTGPRRPRP